MLCQKPMIIEDARADLRFLDNPLVVGDPRIRFYVGVPLLAADGTPLGAICGIDNKPRTIDDAEVRVLQDLANLTMEQLELRRLATLDGLTGALRRAAFLSMSGREFKMAKRQDTPLSCVMIDADHFKSINDVYGHSAGDEVLVALVDTCRRELRSSDLIGRLGGEEFCVLLPGASLADAAEVGERLRTAIGAMAVPQLRQSSGVTVSIGGTQLVPADGSIQELISRADSALYEAKSTGRNRLVLRP